MQVVTAIVACTRFHTMGFFVSKLMIKWEIDRESAGVECRFQDIPPPGRRCPARGASSFDDNCAMAGLSYLRRNPAIHGVQVIPERTENDVRAIFAPSYRLPQAG